MFNLKKLKIMKTKIFLVIMFTLAINMVSFGLATNNMTNVHFYFQGTNNPNLEIGVQRKMKSVIGENYAYPVQEQNYFLLTFEKTIKIDTFDIRNSLDYAHEHTEYLNPDFIVNDERFNYVYNVTDFYTNFSVTFYCIDGVKKYEVTDFSDGILVPAIDYPNGNTYGTLSGVYAISINFSQYNFTGNSDLMGIGGTNNCAFGVIGTFYNDIQQMSDSIITLNNTIDVLNNSLDSVNTVNQSLTTQVSNLTNQVNDLTTQVSELTTTVSTLETEVVSYKDSVSTLETEVVSYKDSLVIYFDNGFEQGVASVDTTVAWTNGYNKGIEDCETSSNEPIKIQDLNVYPNPATVDSELTIETENFNYVEIYTLSGSMLVSATSNTVSLNNLQKGMFILKIYTTDGKVGTQKLVVQ